jgi:hypothetical protein
MKPKTKAEPKVQIKLSIAKSVADACVAARQEATETPYDWNATMAEIVEKENLEFRRHVAEYKAKSQPTAGLTSSPPSSPRTKTLDGAEPEHP